MIKRQILFEYLFVFLYNNDDSFHLKEENYGTKAEKSVDSIFRW